MKRIIVVTIVLILVLISGYVILKDQQEPVSFDYRDSINNTIEDGDWAELLNIEGDLTNDSLLDRVVIIETDSLAYSRERVLFVFLSSEIKDEPSIFVSYGYILCKECGGVSALDALSSVEIDNGELQIVHSGGSSERWILKDKFKVVNDRVLLDERTEVSYSTHNPESENVEVYTADDFGVVTIEMMENYHLVSEDE